MPTTRETIVSAIAARYLRGALSLAIVTTTFIVALCPTSAAGDEATLDQRRIRTLQRELRSWQRCHLIELAFPSWRCQRALEPEPSIHDVSMSLRSLSGLDVATDLQRETGALGWDVGLCLYSMSVDVADHLAERAGRRSRKPRRSRNSSSKKPRSWASRFCDGVAVPDPFDEHLTLGQAGLCAYTIDADGRIRGDALRQCLNTLVASRLASAGVGPRIPRPNIIVILADDQRWDSIDATHSPRPEIGLPAMPATWSRLAREGITFTQTVVTTPVCGPSRGSFFTGKHSHRHGMIDNRGPLGPLRFDDSDTWATRLQDGGYRTGFLGKYTNWYTDLWAPGVEPAYIPPGWDDFRAFNHPTSVPQTRFSMAENGEVVSYDIASEPYSTDVLSLHAARFIEEAVADSPGEPFALWISTTTPHYPWDPAPRHVGAFADLELELYPNHFEVDVSDKPWWIQDLPLNGGDLPLVGERNFRQKHLEMQLSTDEMVAALLDRLERLGIGDDTIILYTSDNGHAWGEHRWRSKACPWEVCLKVPMIVRYPRLVPGARTEPSLTANVDVVPTLLELAGIEPPNDIDGFDLSGAISGFETAPERDVLFETYSGSKHTYAGVREEGLKYFRYSDGSEVLHDLEADPWELDNFVDLPEYADARQRLRDRLEDLWPGFDGVLEDPQ